MICINCGTSEKGMSMKGNNLDIEFASSKGIKPCDWICSKCFWKLLGKEIKNPKTSYNKEG